jgi:diguanylate cyclase (GGDEF)-like protein
MDKLMSENFYDSNKFVDEFNMLFADFNMSNMCNTEQFHDKSHNILLKNLDKDYDIISLNIDRFKVINDLYGTDEGDKLLSYICYVLKRLTNSEYENFGRLYADNFAICKIRDEGYENRLVKALRQYLSMYPLDINITMSFGIYKVDNRNLSVPIMFDRADMALKKIKGSYTNIYAYYEETHRNTLLEEQEIINDMYIALKNEELKVYYQPKYILSDLKLAGAEALVRWMHPKKGLITPDKFIPILEKTGFITEMDEYVWEFTCKSIRKWIDDGLPVVPISVNVSRIDIYNPNLCKNLKALVDKYNIPIKLLELEITETSYMENPAQLIETVINLKKIGFIVEMDDFGTGYSSLNMLNQVPVDVLKLDLRFLKTVNSEGKSANILNSIVSMAKWLDLPVVAEGVETKEQVEFLKSIGCNKAQGYYFAKPMPYIEFEELLSNSINNVQVGGYKLPDVFVDLHEFWDPNSQVNILFNSFVGGLGIFELRGNNFDILRVNNRFYEIFEIDIDTLYKMVPKFREYINNDDRLMFYERLEKAKKENGETTLEFRIKNILTNKMVYVYLRMRVIINNPERTVFMGSVDNITEEKSAQDALKRNQETYHYVMDMTGDVIFEYDIEAKRITNSFNFQKKFGYIPFRESWINSIVSSGLIKDKHIEEFVNVFVKIMNGDQHSVKCKLELKDVNNEYQWYSIYTQGIYDAGNNLIKLIGIITNIDSLKSRLME